MAACSVFADMAWSDGVSLVTNRQDKLPFLSSNEVVLDSISSLLLSSGEFYTNLAGFFAVKKSWSKSITTKFGFIEIIQLYYKRTFIIRAASEKSLHIQNFACIGSVGALNTTSRSAFHCSSVDKEEEGSNSCLKWKSS